MSSIHFRRELLDNILTEPTAPFREGHVIRVLLETLRDGGVPHFQDPCGNIVVGVASQREYRALASRKSAEPIRVFVAHMDHPGFHGAEWTTDGHLRVKWLGGSPTQDLTGARVWIASRGKERFEGEVIEAQLLASGKAIESGIIRIQGGPTSIEAKELFGGFGFRAPVWQEGRVLYTKAADDLVGAFSIVSVALDLFSGRGKKKKKDVPFVGLLTRAEEVGFIGAIAHFELGWLKKAKRPVMGVSLETSRTLPGAEIGKGPVVRLGDRFTIFDAGATRVFSDLAEKVLPGRHQRRIMDGGTCEASAATVYGFPCIAMSVPLGNYHNQCFEGGPDARGALGPAPEFVHLDDVEGLLTLCSAVMKPKLGWEKPWETKARDFKKQLRNYRPLLKSEP